MNNIVKMILALLSMAAVIAYTIYNYTIGQTDLTMMTVCIIILAFPFVNILNLLIQELKNK